MKKEYERIMALKCLARTGWMQKNVPASVAETVAQHTFEVSILSLILCEKLRSRGINVNLERVVLLSLLHDVAESLVGDIPYWTTTRLGSGEKRKLEREAMGELVKPLGLEEVVSKIEPSSAEGVEGLIVELSDALATALQAKRYLSMGFRDVKEILDSSLKRVTSLLENPLLSPLAETIKALVDSP